MGKRVEFTRDQTTHQAYLAEPSAPGPGILLIQEWWGIVPHIEDLANRFAAEGFVVLVPDLYKGESADDPSDAATLMQALHIGETEVLLRDSVDELLAHPLVSPRDRIGAVGFCMGGQLAMFAASLNPKIKAAVNFYGIHPRVKPDYANVAGSILGLFAEHDHRADPSAVQNLEAALTANQVPHEFIIYPDAHHAFFNDTRPEVYNPDAAADAWSRTLAFLRANRVA